MERFLNYLFFAICLLIVSCTTDKLEPEPVICTDLVTYQDGPKAILNKTCAYSGCHVAGYSSGDFSSYDAMKARLDNGKFAKWVLNDRSMPPSNVPTGKDDFLTIEELNILKCWAQEGYLKN